MIDRVFSGNLPAPAAKVEKVSLIERVLRGGYPEAISRATANRRMAWARQYIDAIIQRDVRDVATIEKLDQLPRFLRALAETAGQMCNYTQLGGQVGLDSKTASKYIGVFEQMYLLKRINVWARNRVSRVVKTSKLQFVDSGLLSALLSLNAEKVHQDRTRFGNVLETFVFSELWKHSTTAEDEYNLMYYRDADQFEVDLILENLAGKLVGIEVKAAATVKQSDFRGLRKLQMLAGNDFQMGLVLYDGDETLPLGNNLWAVPLSTLWA